MAISWNDNILLSEQLVDRNEGFGLAAVVSGSAADADFWDAHVRRTARDVFRANGQTTIVPVAEGMPKGNFLGTLNAWQRIREARRGTSHPLPDTSLISMVFGQGKRFSPFTQALGNRKAAFPTPFRGTRSDTNLCSADLSNLHTNPWAAYVSRAGFRGAIVKWGDEAIIPGIPLGETPVDLSGYDIIRFVWATSPTPTLAREKDWIIYRGNEMVTIYARRDARIAAAGSDEGGPVGVNTAVNLGSLALSYDFLDVGCDVLMDDINASNLALDWDPYTIAALCCRNMDEWDQIRSAEAEQGLVGLRNLERRCPDFADKILGLRERFGQVKGRDLRIGVIDFGPVLWADLGLHDAMRRFFDRLLEPSEEGEASRKLFGVDAPPDQNGNRIIRSSVPPTARVSNSLIVDSTITAPDSIAEGAVIVGGTHQRVSMPAGGAALFCNVGELRYAGPHAVALNSAASYLELPEGGRHTTTVIGGKSLDFRTNENVTDYDGENYTTPIFGNPLSFEEVARLVNDPHPTG